MIGPTPRSPPSTPTPSVARVRERSSLVNTGDGKGKSTAAFGMVVRAVARGWPVGRRAVPQVRASGRSARRRCAATASGSTGAPSARGSPGTPTTSTEDEAVAAGGVGATPAALIEAGEPPARRARRDHLPDELGLDRHRRRGRHHRRTAPTTVNVVCTGRDAPDALIDVADTVTEMRKVKHAYDTGVIGQEGHRLLMVRRLRARASTATTDGRRRCSSGAADAPVRGAGDRRCSAAASACARGSSTPRSALDYHHADPGGARRGDRATSSGSIRLRRRRHAHRRPRARRRVAPTTAA